MKSLSRRVDTSVAMMGSLLLVDDDPVFSRILGRALRRRGFDVRTAGSIDDATRALASGPAGPDYALLDLNISGTSSLQLIGPIRRGNPDSRIVIVTGYASVAGAVDAIKLGADEYLAKPVEVDAILKALVGEHAPDAAALPESILSVHRLEWEHIQRVLADNSGNISATARALKMHRRTLQRKLARRPGGTGG